MTSSRRAKSAPLSFQPSCSLKFVRVGGGGVKSLLNPISNFGFSNFIFCLICLVKRPLEIFVCLSVSLFLRAVFVFLLCSSLVLFLSIFCSIYNFTLSERAPTIQVHLSVLSVGLYFWIEPLNVFVFLFSLYFCLLNVREFLMPSLLFAFNVFLCRLGS